MASLFAALILLLTLGAQSAAAGTFHVYGLGLNSSPCPSGWIAQSSNPSAFFQEDRCPDWHVQSVADTSDNQWAGISMFTAPGARFTGASIVSSGDTQNGMYWRLSACDGYFTGCTSAGLGLTGGVWNGIESKVGSLAGQGDLSAHHIFAGLWCSWSTCPSPSGSRAGLVDQRESHVVVDDYTAPYSPTFSGVSAGWNSGQQTLAYSASDAGSGIEAVTLTVDGSLHRTNNHSCTRLPGSGYYTPIPCVQDTGGTFAVNEPGQLADGPHTLTVTSRDAGGLTTTQPQEFLVDNNAPSAPVNLQVVGGDGWRASNDFAVTWENPDQGKGSPVAGAYYKVGAAPTSGTDGTQIEADGARFKVPGDGEWPVYVWLADVAGNANPTRHAVAHVRLDTTSPTLAFDDKRNEHDPAQVRVPTSDSSSGVAGGLIEIRKQGLAEWRPLDTRLEGTELIATIPDDQLERGTYELQATASDAVGNRSTTNLRTDGEAMVVDLPLRGDTQVRANLTRGAEGSGRALPSIKVRYRKAAWLRGVLRSGAGAPLPDTRIAISTRPMGGGDWQPLTELVTDGEGRYAVQLEPGSSREIRVHFAGTRSLRPADDIAKLLVRGWASLKLRPNRLKRGGTITFRGHVGALGAALPATGKLIQIQYLDGRKWRPAVKLGRTDAEGRFAIRYRFRRISRPTKIFFRILVPAEAGWAYSTGASKTRIARVRP